MIIDIDQNETIKQTIKDNTDVYWNEDQNIIIDVLKIKFRILYIGFFFSKNN